MALRIEDYALIGDCETAALVGINGSIDWLCWPDFGSGACFAALVGTPDNGCWRLAPEGQDWRVTRRYRDDTLVLETLFERDQDAVRMIDFMPMRNSARNGSSHLVRIVQGVRGQCAMRMDMALRFDYGRSVPWVTRFEDATRAVAGPDLTALRSSVAVRGEDLKTVADFHVGAGQTAWFTLTHGHSAQPLPAGVDPLQALAETTQSWMQWASRATDAGRYTNAVRRSLITLKALTYRPTGGVVAAVTTSLPEQLGGPRNWDYRYCWLRDSTFTLLALMNGGFYEEAGAWEQWLLRALAGSPEQVQIMYGISGERHLLEWEAPWLAGYENSRPVRIGNAAAEQLQLDIYGEVMDAFYHALHGLKHESKKEQQLGFHLQTALMEHIARIWKQPDQGIWESRSGPQQFTYSKMMVWVAFDRAISIGEDMGADAALLDTWRTVRAEVHDDICTHAWSERLGAFAQSYGSEQLDSSLLLMPLVGFLPASDPRIRSTIEAIERTLMRDGFLLRYDTGQSADGLPPGEGAFLACSFWLVSALKLIGRGEDARRLFERLIALRNDVGLLSEEYDVSRRRQVGNVPQAFSHIALINAAFDLERAETEQRKRHHKDGQQRHLGAA